MLCITVNGYYSFLCPCIRTRYAVLNRKGTIQVEYSFLRGNVTLHSVKHYYLKIMSACMHTLTYIGYLITLCVYIIEVPFQTYIACTFLIKSTSIHKNAYWHAYVTIVASLLDSALRMWNLTCTCIQRNSIWVTLHVIVRVVVRAWLIGVRYPV